MKSILFSLLSILCIGYHFDAQAQCSTVTGDINNNPYVCGLYGDASGNSNWNWEIVDKTDPNYCSMWNARTDNTNNQTQMGSPFVDATTPKLDIISENQDYTKAKGWELLRRDFGCARITAYPYFVLYNRYSGLMRVFVYQPITQQQYSGITLQIQPTNSPYPATTATGDPIQATPDQFLNTTSSSTIGKTVIAVAEPAGSGGWSVAEFDPAFDPNIANAAYTGAGLQFSIYGVVTYGLQAKIGGTTISGSQANLNYSPKTAPTTNGNGLTTFATDGEQFATFGKDIGDLMTSINKTASGALTVHPIDTAGLKGFPGMVASQLRQTAALTSSASSFGTYVSDLSNFLNDAGGVFKVAGAIIGLFTTKKSTPAAAPVYTSVNLTLTGSLTAQYTSETFILRVPGTIQNDNSNGTYYSCPLGIANITTTPHADTVMYKKVLKWYNYGEYYSIDSIYYTAYKIDNTIPFSYYDGTGLQLVSVKGALMGKIMPGSNGKAQYDPMAPEMVVGNSPVANYTPNWMAPDFESGRLQFVFYDTSAAHLHLFQTPFVNLECLNGLSINVPSTTSVYLRIKAVFKDKNDPDGTPILFVQDYKLAYDQGSLTALQRQSLDNFLWQLPPYANYTGVPTGTADGTITNTSYTAAATIQADNSLTASTNVTVSGQGVVFEAGGAVYLEPGFTAVAGSNFQAITTNYGFTTSCGTLQSQAYEGPSTCYNTSVTPLVKKTDSTTTARNAFNNADSLVSFYPIPAAQTVTISGLDGWGHSTITVLDQAGRKLFTVDKTDDSPTIQLNVGGLASGVYFVEVQGVTKALTRKIVVTR